MIDYKDMNSIADLSVEQLRQAANLKEQIEALEDKLRQLLGATITPVALREKGGMSAAGRAKVAAAQRARWAKFKAAKATNPAKKKLMLSPAARAKIIATAEARWTKAKATKQLS